MVAELVARPDGPEARFASVTEQRVELALPALDPGPYDLYVFDDTKQIAYRRAAFHAISNSTRDDLVAPSHP